MTSSVKNYRDLNAIQDVVVELQKRVQVICSDMLHDDNFIVAAGFKVALISAMCGMNEAMAKYKI